MVCITDVTPSDSTFTVAVRVGGQVVGRLLLWVGDHRPYPARAQGDVHHLTFDETAYDFQGVGEYVDAVAGDGTDFAVQSRLEAVPGHPATVTTAVAARVDGDRVAVYLGRTGVPEWYLDGAPLAVPARLPSGGRVTSPSPDRWTVSWPASTGDPGATTGTTMQVSFGRWSLKDHLNIDELLLGPGLAVGQVHGLLGVADRDPANDLTPSTGGAPVSPVLDPARPPYEQPLYAGFGRSWLVTPATTLFDYHEPGHPGPAAYEDAKAPAEHPKVVDEGARAACGEAGVTRWPQIEFCTSDVGATGARDIARNYLDAPRRRR
jgi:hypothetical protein